MTSGAAPPARNINRKGIESDSVPFPFHCLDKSYLCELLGYLVDCVLDSCD